MEFPFFGLVKSKSRNENMWVAAVFCEVIFQDHGQCPASKVPQKRSKNKRCKRRWINWFKLHLQSHSSEFMRFWCTPCPSASSTEVLMSFTAKVLPSKTSGPILPWTSSIFHCQWHGMPWKHSLSMVRTRNKNLRPVGDGTRAMTRLAMARDSLMSKPHRERPSVNLCKSELTNRSFLEPGQFNACG